jgi:AcrR family transcriptional regulator
MTMIVHTMNKAETPPAAAEANGEPANAAGQTAPATSVGGPEFSVRQREVLDAVLALMVEEGDSFSMAAVCRRASCSKETLYNWFGDRDGLLAATVRWQASKVRIAVAGATVDLWTAEP